MIGIVIVAHGGLAREYLLALEHVVGQQSGIQSVAIGAECDREAKQSEVNDAVQAVDTGDGVVVVTDMFGGTPSNLAVEACKADNRAVIYGTNLPLLVKLAKARRMSMKEAVARAVSAGHKYLDCTTKITV
ncbi:PTS fructose transporter subunit IIA [Rhodobacterales bacterium 52_120_T64]|nr:PTS fructose transporter subunit IIA [Rhodobacterales bacterium 52_120_T64]